MSPEAALKQVETERPAPEMITEDDVVIRRHYPLARFKGTFDRFTVLWFDGVAVALIDSTGGVAAHNQEATEYLK